MQRSKGLAKKLAEYRAPICLLGLHEIQRYWKVNNSVLDLSLQHLGDSTRKRLRGGVAEDIPDGDFLNDNLERTSNKHPVAQAPQSQYSPPLSYTSSPVSRDYLTRIAQEAAEHSCSFDIPRNISNQRGSADDFNFVLDQCFLGSNKISLDLNDRQNL
jgi:hypothetical protein